ncbi:MAG: FHA domain-containing protein [Deltaproteobacteria bacterium]|nr:FHA domain-containing protein [Deltaproteobacteria bacterium]
MAEALVSFDTNPGNVGVRVTVHNEVDGSTTDLLFKQFPVRIGRNSLNDLVLGHPYVSNWHAVLGFVRGQLTIVQVGSSNPVVVDERRLSPNEDFGLGQSHTIRILPFTLHVRLMQMPQTPQVVSPTAAVRAAVEGGAGPGALEHAALQSLDRLSRRFLGRPLDDPHQIAAFTQQLEQTLDVFLRCFIALRTGQEQFRQALDIKALGQGANTLDRARDAMALGALLLSGVDANAVPALEHAFKNIMIHQIALLNGLMAGVRTLLGKLSPERVTKEASRERRSPSARHLWETFVELHHDLAEEDNETFDTIFGKQFSKAYASLVGGETGEEKI